MIFHGRTLDDGKIQITRRDAMVAEMRKHKHFHVVIRRKRKFRSSEQNRYYWGVVLDYISNETGHEPDELHTAFKMKYLKKYDANGLQFIQSTTELTTCEFMAYIEQVRRFAAVELSIAIPDPEETD